MSLDIGCGGLFVTGGGGGGGGGGINYLLPFGANMTTTGFFAVSHGDAASFAAPTNNQIATDITLPTGGRLTQLAVFTTSADATTVIRINIDGFAAQSVTLTGSGRSCVPLDILLEGPCQSVSVEYFSGAAPGRSTFSVLVEEPAP